MEKDIEQSAELETQESSEPAFEHDEVNSRRLIKLAKAQQGVMVFMQVYVAMLVYPILLYYIPGGLYAMKFGHPVVSVSIGLLILGSLITGLIFPYRLFLNVYRHASWIWGVLIIPMMFLLSFTSAAANNIYYDCRTLIILPFLGLLFILFINLKATRILKSNGVKVGFFNTNMN